MALCALGSPDHLVVAQFQLLRRVSGKALGFVSRIEDATPVWPTNILCFLVFVCFVLLPALLCASIILSFPLDPYVIILLRHSQTFH